jgi:hypothetical protein
MVPNPVPQPPGVASQPPSTSTLPTPQQPAPIAKPTAVLRIRNQTLQSTFQRDLFSTELPFDMTASPTLTFTPTDTGGPAVTITVLNAANSSLATITTTQGQTFTTSLSAITPGSFAGTTVRLLIEPVAGQLGDGL